MIGKQYNRLNYRNATTLVFGKGSPPEKYASLEKGWYGYFILQKQIREVAPTFKGLKNERQLSRGRLLHFHDSVFHHRVPPRRGRLLSRLPLSIYLLKVVGTEM